MLARLLEIGGLAFSLLTISAPVSSRPTGLTDSAAIKFGGTSWSLVRRVSEISPAVRSALSRRFFAEDPRMADPGGAFSSTDLVRVVPAPRRRLLLAGHVGTRWFVAYEVGGRGYHHTLVEYELGRGAPRLTLLARGMFVKEHSRRVELGEIVRALRSPGVHVESVNTAATD